MSFDSTFCPRCSRELVAEDKCRCGWELPAPGGGSGGFYRYTKENGFGRGEELPPPGGTFEDVSARAALQGALRIKGNIETFAPLAVALDALEAFDATDAGPGRHEALASILDDICRAWKILKEKV